MHLCLCVISICSTPCTTGGGGEIPWCFSQVKGTIEDEVADGKDTDITSPACLPPPTQPRKGGRIMVAGVW